MKNHATKTAAALTLHPLVSAEPRARDVHGLLHFVGLDVAPDSGTCKLQESRDEALEVYTTRGLIEEQAARLAVRRLTAQDLDTLDELALSMESAVVARKFDSVPDLRRQLHRTIYRAAQSGYLLRLIEDLWTLSARYSQGHPYPVSGDSSDDLYFVRSIVSACRLKDANALGLMIRHQVHQSMGRIASP